MYKKTILICLSLCFCSLTIFSQKKGTKPVLSKSEKSTMAKMVTPTTVIKNNQKLNMDTLSYSLGLLLGQNIKQMGFDKLNSDNLCTAIQDVLNGKTPSISAEEAQTIVTGEMASINERKSASVISEGKNFLIENAKRPEVKTTNSGLQYEVLTIGTGISPKATDKVETNYEGKLINGSIFDSSYKRGEPATFGVNQVIKGWTEALQLMKEGDKWRLYIPYNLAYGERGAGHDIPPYATLIFDVELIKVNP